MSRMMRLDDVVLDELKRDSGTAGEIGDRISARVYTTLERLRFNGQVRRNGYPAKYALVLKRRGPIA